MWIFTKKSFNGCPLFFQFLRNNEFFIINFTNLKQMFSKKIHLSLFASKHLYSTTNKNVEINEESLLKFLENLSAVDMDNIHLNFFTDNLIFKTEIDITLIQGFPQLKLKFELDVINADNFYSNLTCPLLEIIQLLKRNQDELFDLIKKKDLEIAEYILEGGNILHKNIKTDVFDKDEFLINSLQKYKNTRDEHPNFYEMCLFPLIEQVNESYSYMHKELNNKPNEVNKKEFQKIPLKKKFLNQNSSTSTDFEITDTSIKIKKKKTTHVLKNL